MVVYMEKYKNIYKLLVWQLFSQIPEWKTNVQNQECALILFINVVNVLKGKSNKRSTVTLGKK